LNIKNILRFKEDDMNENFEKDLKDFREQFDKDQRELSENILKSIKMFEKKYDVFIDDLRRGGYEDGIRNMWIDSIDFRIFFTRGIGG